jgi:hypothetical protein
MGRGEQVGDPGLGAAVRRIVARYPGGRRGVGVSARRAEVPSWYRRVLVVVSGVPAVGVGVFVIVRAVIRGAFG